MPGWRATTRTMAANWAARGVGWWLYRSRLHRREPLPHHEPPPGPARTGSESTRRVVGPRRSPVHPRALRLEQDEEGVTARILDRATEEEYTVRADYLLGADGGHSSAGGRHRDVRTPRHHEGRLRAHGRGPVAVDGRRRGVDPLAGQSRLRWLVGKRGAGPDGTGALGSRVRGMGLPHAIRHR